jgi:hypothetical protein
MPMHVSTMSRLALFTLALSACRTPSIGRPSGPLALVPMFGPAVANEVIGGRADDERGVWLLVGGEDLVYVDLVAQRVSRAAIRLSAGEHCWGLARLADGTLWTLKGRHSVIQVAPDGAVARDIALADPNFGLFAAGDRLVYQLATLTAPGPALNAAAPGDTHLVPWSGITTRTFAGIARAQAAALNMVACGATVRLERPCWFPDEAAVSLVTTSGATRRLVLRGLDLVAPAELLAAENPRRPVRDAYLDRDGRLSVLSSGVPPAGAAERPGGWVLARYSADGTLDRISRLQDSVRLILRAEGGRLVVLSGDGRVAAVAPW